MPSLPEAPPHLTSKMSLTVRFCETDLMGIVHHANYLVYFEAGRVDWLHRRGVRYEAWARRGIHLPVVETRLRFRKAARFDETLEIATTCHELTRVTVRFGYVITRGDDRICEGDTLLACVGVTSTTSDAAEQLAPKRFPADVAETFRAPEIGLR